MTDQRLLTTRELAELLRIRERKVYDLAAAFGRGEWGSPS